jgi:hypothetical protein
MSFILMACSDQIASKHVAIVRYMTYIGCLTVFENSLFYDRHKGRINTIFYGDPQTRYKPVVNLECTRCISS